MAIIPGLYGLDSYSAWRTFSKDPQKYLDRFSKDKTVQKEIDYFNKKAPTFKDVDALLKDRRALQYLLDSYGLGSEINNIGRLKKILTEDPTASGSLSSRLADPKFAAMAKDLRLDLGMDKLSRSATVGTVEDQYIQHEYEEALGNTATQIRQTADAESNYFDDAVAKAKSVDALLKDERVVKYILDSYGLGGASSDMAKVKQILTEDPTKSSSLVNRLADSRFAQMAKELRMDQGLDGVRSDAFAVTAKENYIKNNIEATLTARVGDDGIAAIKANAQKEIDYFNQNASKFKDVDTLLKDTRALQYLLDAYHVGDQVGNTSSLKKIFSEDPTVKGSYLSTLSDPDLEKMAKDLRLDQGMDKLTRVTFLDDVKQKYLLNEFEEALGEQDATLRQAAYFARTSGNISDVYQVLGDKILWNVTTAAFNLPQEFAVQSVESQAAYLTRRIDFTKFSESIGSGASAAQLARAKSDFTLLQSSLGVSDKAINQINSLQSQLNELATSYSGLSAATDPSGVNAATIAQQQTAVPELLRYEQLLQGGSTALSRIDQQLDTMLNFIEQAKVPGADLAALKSQFSSFVDSLNDAINEASITAPDGSTQNILLNGSADTISTTINSNGTQVTINRYDVSAFQTMISNAEAAFNAVTDSSDSANLLTAQARLLVGQDQMKAVSQTMSADITAFEKAVNEQDFYATLNTTQLQKGNASVTDALSRISQIEELLEKIQDIAAESKNRTPSQDRSDLEASFDDYKTQIRDLIEDAGDPGLDNFLNNIPDQSYEITAGNSIKVKGGYDLVTRIANILDAGSISDQTSASALEISAIQVTNATDSAKAGLQVSQPILNHALNTYDPRGKLDNQIYMTRATLEGFIDDAAARANGKKNLLDPDQKNITLSLATGVTVTLRAQSSFQNSLTDSLDDLVDQVAAGNMAGILSALDDTLFLVNSTKRALENDNRTATMELGKLGGIIDTLDPKKTSNTDNPYKINAFTEKFLVRYLSQTASTSSTASGPNSYVLGLFGSSGSDNSSAFSSIMSLSMQI